jgi:hypothetical protein
MTATLPIRDIGDAKLADQLQQGGCPLCRVREDAAQRFLDAVLWESVNDVGFRARFARGRGFCRRHSTEVLAKSRAEGQLTGGAILLGAALRVHLSEVEALLARRRGRSEVARARKPADCPVCEQMSIAERAASETLIGKLEDPAWTSAVASTELCLEDLLVIWQVALQRGSTAWPAVATIQVTRIRDLADRLDGLAHHSSFDRRHLQTDAEGLAPEEAARFLGGSDGGTGRPGT